MGRQWKVIRSHSLAFHGHGGAESAPSLGCALIAFSGGFPFPRMIGERILDGPGGRRWNARTNHEYCRNIRTP